jgi:hypothetical protein
MMGSTGKKTGGRKRALCPDKREWGIKKSASHKRCCVPPTHTPRRHRGAGPWGSTSQITLFQARITPFWSKNKPVSQKTMPVSRVFHYFPRKLRRRLLDRHQAYLGLFVRTIFWQVTMGMWVEYNADIRIRSITNERWMGRGSTPQLEERNPLKGDYGIQASNQGGV